MIIYIHIHQLRRIVKIKSQNTGTRKMLIKDFNEQLINSFKNKDRKSRNDVKKNIKINCYFF